MGYMITAPLKNEYFFPLGFIYLKKCSYPQFFTVHLQTCAGGSGAKQGENMKNRFIGEFTYTLSAIRKAYTGRGLRRCLAWAGYTTPDNLTSMYLNGEPAEYILAACIACDTVGA